MQVTSVEQQPSGTAGATGGAPVSRPQVRAAASRDEFARRDPVRFAGLAIQLALLLVVFHLWKIETPQFFRLCIVAFGGFVIHYLTPFAHKQKALIALSLAGVLYLLKEWDNRLLGNYLAFLGPLVLIGFVVVVGLTIYLILRTKAPFGVRAAALVGLGCGLAYLRVTDKVNLLPDGHWRIVGAIFMFRVILYAYEVKVARQPERLGDFLSYFLLLPNFYFVLFPVIDYTTFKKGYFSEDVHRIAQRGIWWMTLGTIQLLAYRVLYQLWCIGPEDVRSLSTLLQWLFVPYLLYLRVSGQFHIIVGMLHLFGYKLPPTNRWYFFAPSFTEFWRRINIYWKDFMVRVVYYPAYFRWRKRSEKIALVAATLLVFVVTCLLHSYQAFWLAGTFDLKDTDLAFWGILGLVVMIAVLRESGRRPAAATGRGRAFAKRALSTACVFVCISLLWSLWSSYSLSEWWETLTQWMEHAA